MPFIVSALHTLVSRVQMCGVLSATQAPVVSCNRLSVSHALMLKSWLLLMSEAPGITSNSASFSFLMPS